MICANCNKSITNGYFNESEEGMKCICIDCLLRFDSFRKRRKYDYKSIYKMHEAGFCDRTIATIFDTNPLTISGIIRDIERSL